MLLKIHVFGRITMMRLKEPNYICGISPEHLYYNIMYHISREEITKEELEQVIRKLIFGSIKKWEKNSDQ